MLRRWLKVLLPLVLFTLVGCTNPIYNVADQYYPAGVEKVSLDKIEKVMISAMNDRGWIVTNRAPGKLSARYNKGQLVAEIVVLFDSKKYSIQYVSSQNLRASGDTIHRRYNNWIHYLEQDINRGLSNLAFQ